MDPSPDQPTRQYRYALQAVPAIISLQISLSALIGWICKAPLMNGLFPGSVPVGINAAVCFMCLSISIIVFNIYETKRVLGLLSLAVFFICSLTISKHLLDLSPPFDNIFLLFGDENNSPCMSMNSAIAIGLLALSTFRLTQGKIEKWWLLICIATLVAGSVGFVALLGYLFNIQNAYSWMPTRSMAPLTAFCVCLLSGSLFIGVYLDNGHTKSETKLWAGMFNFAVGLTASLMLWAWMTADQTRFIKSQIQSDVEAITDSLNNKMQADAYNSSGKEVRGIVAGIFRTSLLLQTILGAPTENSFSILITDNSSGGIAPFYTYNPDSLAYRKNGEFLHGEYACERLITFGSKKWKLTFVPSGHYLVELKNWFPAIVLLVGLVFTFVSSFYVCNVIGSNRRHRAVIKRLDKKISEGKSIERAVGFRTQ